MLVPLFFFSSASWHYQHHHESKLLGPRWYIFVLCLCGYLTSSPFPVAWGFTVPNTHGAALSRGMRLRKFPSLHFCLKNQHLNFKCPCTTKHEYFMSKNNDDDVCLGEVKDEDIGNEVPSTSTSNDTNPKKPMSRLAMAAADWMEDDEEDELMAYWDRYDAAKSNSEKRSKSTIASKNNDNEGSLNNLTTDERLDRYFQSRGIDKSMESKYESRIQDAVSHAKNKSPSANDAIRVLEPLRDYMQAGSNLGGTALLELAYAYQAYHDASSNEENNENKIEVKSGIEDSHGEVMDGNGRNYEEEYQMICQAIMEKNSLRDIRARAKQLLEDPRQYGKKYYERRNFWQSFDSWWS